MKTIFMVFLVALLLVSMTSAQSAPSACSNGAVEIDSNPENTITICDDPQDSTCEQDFETLCPTDWHLCSPDEYNSGNDNWQGTISNNWLLGEITCREFSGAGHYTIRGDGNPYSLDVPFNQHAGSSLPECQSNYGCNEKQHYALCCIGEGEVPPPNGDVPEFGIIGALLAIATIGGFALYKRKN